MTQHHDPVHPDQPDEPGLDPADDAFVHELLARVPEVAMPDDVLARLLDALAAEPDLALVSAGDGDAAGDADTGDSATAATTVVPLDSRRRDRTRILQVAAAVVLVVAGGTFAVKTFGQSSTSAPTSAGAGALATDGSALPPSVTTSGTAYTASNLAASVLGLQAGPRGPAGQPSAPQPEKSSAFGTAQIVTDTAMLARCVAAVQGNPVEPGRAVSIDVGTFDGKPAVVVAVQSSDPAVLSTYVTTPDCGTTAEPTILYFANVHRP